MHNVPRFAVVGFPCREQLRRRLIGMGVGGVGTSSIFTAASVLAAAAAARVSKRKKVFVVGGKGLKGELDALKVQNIGQLLQMYCNSTFSQSKVTKE